MRKSTKVGGRRASQGKGKTSKTPEKTFMGVHGSGARELGLFQGHGRGVGDSPPPKDKEAPVAPKGPTRIPKNQGFQAKLGMKRRISSSRARSALGWCHDMRVMPCLSSSTSKRELGPTLVPPMVESTPRASDEQSAHTKVSQKGPNVRMSIFPEQNEFLSGGGFST